MPGIVLAAGDPASVSALDWLLNATIPIGPGILWREVIGDIFGIASALLGMRRNVWAWPIGILGNVLLFTVFLGGVFMTPQDINLDGQAGRQVMFLVLSVYGWVTWSRTRIPRTARADFVPRWMTARERALAIALLAVALPVTAWVLSLLDSYGPWPDAWILLGSAFATFALARGWIEAWVGWIAVDLVGVPLLASAGYYPSALLYSCYLVLAGIGIASWLRLSRTLPQRR
jgi:nicotinamide mononucleotide transporter